MIENTELPENAGSTDHTEHPDDTGLPEDALRFAHQLFDAAREGNEAFLISAVQQGVSVDLTDAKGNTLVMLAAYHGHAALTAALIGFGADVNRLNDRGQSPLAGAVFKKDEAVIRELLQAGADRDLGSPSAKETAAMFGVDLDSL